MVGIATGLRRALSTATTATRGAPPAPQPATSLPTPATDRSDTSVTPARASAADQLGARRRFAAAVPVRFAMADVATTVSTSTATPPPAAPLQFSSDQPSFVGTVRLGPDGVMELATGVRPYTRSYAQATQGPLREAHGSAAPVSSVLTDDERAALAAQAPGVALDRMAAALGVDGVAFDAMAHSKDFYDPAQKSWWGLCAQWSWSSLNPRVSRAVDIDGPAGQRGGWLAGQWISRADLGNWAMATSKSFVEIAMLSASAQSRGAPTPVDLIKSMSALRAGGPGYIMDVHNDAARGSVETWNQPVFAARVEQRSVPASVEQALLERAAAAGFHGATAKLVTVTPTWGVERADDWEGDPAVKQSTWNMYVVAGKDGELQWGAMANDPSLSGIAGLPVTKSDPPPDYLAMAPTSLIDEAMDQSPYASAHERHPYGKEFNFFMGTVLPNVVPGAVRTAFETEIAALPPGAIDAAMATSLAERYGKVANAYSDEQWQRAFGSRGLPAQQFGALTRP